MTKYKKPQMIFEKNPRDWKDLQKLTAKVFSELGCSVEVEKTIQTARGKVEVDVFVEDPTYSPPLSILCECKYWSAPIPKTIIHAFRTVVADFGGNRGYVISKVGFQSGAREAVKNSNIELVNWLEFQAIFSKRWVESMTERLYEPANMIFEYMDILADRMKIIDWTEEKKLQHENLFYRSGLYIHANQWSQFPNREEIVFPVEIPSPESPIDDHQRVTLHNHREYFDLAFSMAPILLKEWKEFLGEK